MTYTRLGDICLKICSGGTPTSSNVSYYNGGIPWLNTNEVNFCNIYSTSKTISQKGLDNSAAKYIPVNTVIIAMYGVTAGKSAIAKIPLTTNQACCNLVIDEKQADYRYVYYFLKIQSENLNKLANGGAQQNLNSQIIKRFKIALPSLPVQNHIASILSTYDTLIENNMKRIRLLEKMAENLYKEWFVRFRFPGHENVEMVDGLPKGWRQGKLGDIAKFLNGFAFQSKSFCTNGDYAIVTIKNVQANGFNGNNTDKIKEIPTNMPEHCKLHDGDILLSLTGNIGRVCRVLGTGYLLNQRVAKLLSKNPFFCYCTFRSDYIFQSLNIISYGTAQLNLSPVKASKIKMQVPTGHLIELFEEKVTPLFAEANNLQRQNALLARQRDLLLPRLMSGRLEIRC